MENQDLKQYVAESSKELRSYVIESNRELKEQFFIWFSVLAVFVVIISFFVITQVTSLTDELNSAVKNNQNTTIILIDAINEVREESKETNTLLKEYIKTKSHEVYKD